MLRDITKVPVGREHCQIVSQAKLGQERVDCAYLNAGAAAFVSERRRIDMIAPVGNQKRKCGKPIQDLLAIPWPREALQEFLQDEAGAEERLPGLDGAHQFAQFRRRGGPVASKCERPHAGIDKQAQLRLRSAL